MTRKKYSLLFLLGLCILGLPRLSAQPLDSLLQIARKQNLNLASLDKSYQSALQQAPQMRLLPQTELGLGAFVSPVQTRVGPQRFRLGIMQNLPWFGTLDAQEALSLAAAKPLANQVEVEALNISYKISIAYYSLYEIQKTQSIIRQNIELLKSLRTLSLRKIEGGKASTTDVLRLDIKLRELNKKVQILDKQLVEPQAEINQLLNRNLETEIRFSETLSFAHFKPLSDSLSQQLKDHPALVYLHNKQEQAKRTIDLNDKKTKPSLGFGLEYLWIDDIPSVDILNNGRDVLQLKASLRIPLQRKPFHAKKQEELLKIEAMEQQKEFLHDRFLANLQKSWARYEEAELNYELYQEQVASTRSVIQIIQTDYSNNGKRFDELINLEMDLLAYQIKLLNSIVESHKVKAAIDRIIF